MLFRPLGVIYADNSGPTWKENFPDIVIALLIFNWCVYPGFYRQHGYDQGGSNELYAAGN